MEWIPGDQSSKPGLPIQHKDYAAPQGAVTARSRSPSRDRQAAGTDSGRRYRERSRSPSRKDSRARHDVTHHDGEDSRSHRSGRSRTSHHHHHRRHRDQESDRGKDREARRIREHARPSNTSRRDDRREPSPASRTHDYWDDRDMISRSGSRYSSSHHCIDSTLEQHHSSADNISPTPTPQKAPPVRLPPPETERHYSSHRCHHHSHDHSPTRSTAPPSHSDHHRPRRRSSPPRWQAAAATPKPVVLPYGARALSRWDFAAFEPLFAHHLEKHQQTRMADLDEESVRDRWKGFVSKWNAGELERSWYEPEMFLRVVRLRALEEARVRAAASISVVPASNRRDGDPSVVSTPPLTGASFASEMMESVVSDVTGYTGATSTAVMDDEDPEDDDDDDDGYAPPMPPATAQPAAGESSDSTSRPAPNPKPGPTIPSLQDLELRRTLESEAASAQHSSLRLLRQADRLEQKSRLDDLLPPRAEAGTRERALEKRKLTTEAMREFASSREPGGEVEIGEAELLGTGGADDYRRMLAGLRRRRTEREVRREEVVRARDVERDGRVAEARAREEERVGVLREMARRRFG